MALPFLTVPALYPPSGPPKTIFFPGTHFPLKASLWVLNSSPSPHSPQEHLSLGRDGGPFFPFFPSEGCRSRTPVRRFAFVLRDLRIAILLFFLSCCRCSSPLWYFPPRGGCPRFFSVFFFFILLPGNDHWAEGFSPRRKHFFLPSFLVRATSGVPFFFPRRHRGLLFLADGVAWQDVPPFLFFCDLLSTGRSLFFFLGRSRRRFLFPIEPPWDHAGLTPPLFRPDPTTSFPCLDERNPFFFSSFG